jgi:hypothetical protein
MSNAHSQLLGLIRKMKTALIIISFLIGTAVYGQNELDSFKITDIYGNWKFHKYRVDDENCDGVTLDPINLISFGDYNSYSIKTDSTILTGTYRLIEKQIELFDTEKNGIPQDGKQNLIIYSIDKTELIFEIPIECGMILILFNKK